MAQPTDEEVLRRVKQGERSAFVILFDRYFDSVERYARCHLLDTRAASRAATATFMTALRDACRRRSATVSYPAYLFVVCRRFLVRATRRYPAPRIQSLMRLESNAVAIPELDELPLSIILSFERDALIRTAMEGLSLEDREIIHLSFEPCLRQADVGFILKQPSNTRLTASLTHALRRLGSAVLQAGCSLPIERGTTRDRVKHWART